MQSEGFIHPTAVIDPRAQLGRNVRIGPYAVIDGPAQIGDDCEISAHAIVTGWVRMGSKNHIGYGAVIGGDPQDIAFDPQTPSWVILGERNRIREHATIHRGAGAETQTRIGNDCFLMCGAHIGHNAQIADHVIMANNVLLAGHVRIDERCFLGGGSVFHQFVHIGKQVMVQGNAGFSKNVPPFLIAAQVNFVAGLNVVGLRRSGMNAQERQEIKSAFKLLYLSGHNTRQALAIARERSWGEAARGFFDFVENSQKRGICALLAPARGEEQSENEA